MKDSTDASMATLATETPRSDAISAVSGSVVRLAIALEKPQKKKAMNCNVLSGFRLMRAGV